MSGIHRAGYLGLDLEFQGKKDFTWPSSCQCGANDRDGRVEMHSKFCFREISLGARCTMVLQGAAQPTKASEGEAANQGGAGELKRQGQVEAYGGGNIY